jgi:hypothetical protein
MPNAFQSLKANIEGNIFLREPQIQSYIALKNFYQNHFKISDEREVGIVLPVGVVNLGA